MTIKIYKTCSKKPIKCEKEICIHDRQVEGTNTKNYNHAKHELPPQQPFTLIHTICATKQN